MWNRVQLKTNAKNILRKNYWWAVLIAIILSVITGGITFTVGELSGSSNHHSNFTEYDDYAFESELGDTYGIYENNQFYKLHRNITNIIYRIRDVSKTALYVLLSLIFIIVIAASLLRAFVFAPLEVGCRRWLILNRTMKPDFGELGNNFKTGYLNTVKIMFCKDLFVFLWSLLFFIPGIIKSYEYRMIPYLLAENPDMDMRDAFAISKDMMDGNKGDAFVLDLSFIGWILLSSFTFGLLTIFFVNPYIHLTDTELYVALCGGNNNSGNANKKTNSEQSEYWREV